MGKNIFKLLIFCIFLHAIVSCEQEIWDHPGREDSTPALTVSEARACFEQQVASIATRSCVSPMKSGLNTDFTPLWNQAVVRSTPDASFVTIPIQSATWIGVWDKEQTANGMQQFPGMRVQQKLMVMKDRKGNKASYVMSFIP